MSKYHVELEVKMNVVMPVARESEQEFLIIAPDKIVLEWDGIEANDKDEAIKKAEVILTSERWYPKNIYKDIEVLKSGALQTGE